MSQVGASVLGHVVRRGLEYSTKVDDSLEHRAQAWEELNYDFPTWGIYLVAGTVIFFVIQILKYDYIVGQVVSTLAMIEEPSSTLIIETKATETISDEEPDATIEKAPLFDVEQTVQTIPNKPITSKIRTTIKHITAQGGWTTRYRGLGIGIFYMGLRLWVTTLLFALLPSFGAVSHVLIAGVSAVLVSPVHAIWTHSTITKPVSNLSLSQYTKTHAKKMPWKAILLPAFGAAVAAEATVQLTLTSNQLVLILLEGTKDWRAAAGFLAVFIISITSILFCALPALTVLKRVEASLLPEEFETLVPFDRTFGGMLNAEVVGISAVARMKAARRSVSRGQFKRIAGVYMKACAIVFALMFLAAHVVGLEMMLIMGDAFKTLCIAASAQMEQAMQAWQN